MSSRRAFIALLGGAAAEWALAASGRKDALPVIGFLRSASLVDAKHLVAAFQQGLRETGFVEGQNVLIEYRSAESRRERLPSIVRELIALPVDIIVANQIAAIPAKAATTRIPIVFMAGSDPVKDGLVERLNRPGANVTGVVFFGTYLGAKRLERLRELLPGNRTIGMLVTPGNVNTESERRDVQAAAHAIGQKLVTFDVSSKSDLEPAFAAMARQGVAGLLAGGGAFMNSQREHVVSLAARHAIPAIYPNREFVQAGGLMSLGGSITQAYRQAGVYAGRILHGERPGDLPVIQSNRLEFVLNMKTARTLKLAVPPAVAFQADEIIE
jgi:putative tryptophan/tyrosine transport system substrate-binding protein